MATTLAMWFDGALVHRADTVMLEAVNVPDLIQQTGLLAGPPGGNVLSMKRLRAKLNAPNANRNRRVLRDAVLGKRPLVAFGCDVRSSNLSSA